MSPIVQAGRGSDAPILMRLVLPISLWRINAKKTDSLSGAILQHYFNRIAVNHPHDLGDQPFRCSRR